MTDRLPDFEVLDHSGNRRHLSELVGDDSSVLQTYRGPWCPKEKRSFAVWSSCRTSSRWPTAACCRSASIRPQWPMRSAPSSVPGGPFLCDPERDVLGRLGLRETTDIKHDPYLLRVFVVRPDLTVHREYDGYWFVGRPTNDQLFRDLRELTAEMRTDFAAPAA